MDRWFADKFNAETRKRAQVRRKGTLQWIVGRGNDPKRITLSKELGRNCTEECIVIQIHGPEARNLHQNLS